MTITSHRLTNSTDFDSVLKQFGFIVDRQQSKYWNLVKCFDCHDGKWKTLVYVHVPEQARHYLFTYDIKDQPNPPDDKLRKSESKLFKEDEELFFGDKSSKTKRISVKSILESIHLDALKLDLSDA